MRRDDRLEDFMRGFAAAVELSVRAASLGCFVECVCLTASVIDAQLRVGLILKHQLDTRTDGLLDELLYQGDSDPILHERDIYRRALEAGVIDQALFDELESAYLDRNRVVHRYVVSGVTTRDILEIAMRQDALERRVTLAISALEQQQLDRGVGMVATGDDVGLREVLEFAASKHGDDKLARLLRGGL